MEKNAGNYAIMSGILCTSQSQVSYVAAAVSSWRRCN